LIPHRLPIPPLLPYTTLYRRPTPIPGVPRARRYAVSPLRGPLLGYDDEHLGARERRQAFLQGHVVVPLGHDRDASRPAADRDLAVPAGQVAAAPRAPPAARARGFYNILTRL